MSRPVHVVFLLILALGHCSALFEECTRGNGVQYRGQQQKSSSGGQCLNWSNANRDYDVTLHPDLATGVGDHNYCRNPDDSGELWCYVSAADGQQLREACSVEACQDKNCTGAVTCAMSLAEEVTTETVGGAPVQPVLGVSQRVKTGPKKKNDLGIMGYVLAIIMMAIIIVLGVGITLGYIYKRGVDLKKQHDQNVYEREMHRITLPLSAFANPTCELVDENTIEVAAEPTEQAPSQAAVEGSDPLIDSAGTPGA